MLRLMLTSHPNIVIPPECGFAIWWAAKYENWQIGQVPEFIADLKSSKKIETWNLDYPRLVDFLNSQRPTSYANVVSLVYEFYARSRKPGFQRWGDKNNFYLDHVPALHALFPCAQFVHIVRDGRDVACSYRKLSGAKIESCYAPKLPGDVREIARLWKSNLQTVADAFSAIPRKQALMVRYEDVVRQTELTLRRISTFLGQEFDPIMLDYHHLNKMEKLEPAEFLQWKANTLNKPMPERIGNFAHELTWDETNAFEEIAETALKSHGYELGCQTPKL